METDRGFRVTYLGHLRTPSSVSLDSGGFLTTLIPDFSIVKVSAFTIGFAIRLKPTFVLLLALEKGREAPKDIDESIRCWPFWLWGPSLDWFNNISKLVLLPLAHAISFFYYSEYSGFSVESAEGVWRGLIDFFPWLVSVPFHYGPLIHHLSVYPLVFHYFLRLAIFASTFFSLSRIFFLFPINFVFNQPFCNFKFFVPNNSMVKSNNLKNFGYYIIVFDLMSFTSTRIFGNIIL